MHRSLALFVTALLALGVRAAEHRAASAADIDRLAAALRPGDHVILDDGPWHDQVLLLRGKGAAEQPITFRATTPGRVVLSGKSSITIEGEHVVVSGLLLKGAGMPGDGIAINGSHCRLSETAVINCTHKFYVHLRGFENRVDRCYLADKANGDPTLQVEVDEKANRHRIDHNHFGPRPPLGRNGGETIRVGYSHQSMRSSQTIVEHNLFDRCDGELEIISSKSCDNVYRFNTFFECAGTLTLRHGNRCTVESNYFLGRGKKGSGGIRIIGDDHIITNNYIDGVDRGAFWITSGIPNSELKGYFQARNCLIAFNTVVDSRGPAVELDAGIGTSGRTLRPENITIANNIFSLKQGTLIKGEEGAGFKWVGNFAASPTGHKGFGAGELKLERGKDNLWRPAAESPARGAAGGEFQSIKADIEGQPRTGRIDSGCDQHSDAPATNRPLGAPDVGPKWLDRSTGGLAPGRNAAAHVRRGGQDPL